MITYLLSYFYVRIYAIPEKNNFSNFSEYQIFFLQSSYKDNIA